MDMEKKSICCSYQFKDKLMEYYSLFGYHLLEEKDFLFSRKKLVFLRDEASEEVKKVEKKYQLSPFLNFFPIVIACVMIVVLTTLFLVFALRGGGDRFSYFVYFMVPTFVLLPLIALYTCLRYHFDNKNIEILMKVNDIKKELEGK